MHFVGCYVVGCYVGAFGLRCTFVYPRVCYTLLLICVYVCYVAFARYLPRITVTVARLRVWLRLLITHARYSWFAVTFGYCRVCSQAHAHTPHVDFIYARTAQLRFTQLIWFGAGAQLLVCVADLLRFGYGYVGYVYRFVCCGLRYVTGVVTVPRWILRCRWTAFTAQLRAVCVCVLHVYAAHVYVTVYVLVLFRYTATRYAHLPRTRTVHYTDYAAPVTARTRWVTHPLYVCYTHFTRLVVYVGYGLLRVYFVVVMQFWLFWLDYFAPVYFPGLLWMPPLLHVWLRIARLRLRYRTCHVIAFALQLDLHVCYVYAFGLITRLLRSCYAPQRYIARVYVTFRLHARWLFTFIRLEVIVPLVDCGCAFAVIFDLPCPVPS